MRDFLPVLMLAAVLADCGSIPGTDREAIAAVPAGRAPDPQRLALPPEPLQGPPPATAIDFRYRHLWLQGRLRQ